ncbi:MAG: hypothetical protein FWD97_02600 [Defluviitaleaceae bacterium]|nr:hypothetical protein [Defluviitaleaceae bacterium]
MEYLGESVYKIKQPDQRLINALKAISWLLWGIGFCLLIWHFINPNTWNMVVVIITQALAPFFHRHYYKGNIYKYGVCVQIGAWYKDFAFWDIDSIDANDRKILMRLKNGKCIRIYARSIVEYDQFSEMLLGTFKQHQQNKRG